MHIWRNPASGTLTIPASSPRRASKIRILGSNADSAWTQQGRDLHITGHAPAPGNAAVGVRITAGTLAGCERLIAPSLTVRIPTLVLLIVNLAGAAEPYRNTGARVAYTGSKLCRLPPVYLRVVCEYRDGPFGIKAHS